MMRMLRFLGFVACAVLGNGGVAFAQMEGFADRVPTDVAGAWLDLLLRGIRLPAELAAQAPNLDAVAGALHRALGVYSISILVLAVLLLFYNLAVMVAETAHTGVPFGRRSAQLWAPVRLVLAIGFLVPVSGGLNSGQYLVGWMAQKGSALATRAWDTAAEGFKGGVSGIAMPRGPDVAAFVAAGFEMELCRALYRHAFDASGINPAVRYVGNIGEIDRLPRSRFADETWLYSNRLHADVPLCGAYRFAAMRVGDAGGVTAAGTFDRLNDEFADFARAEAGHLVGETQLIAENSARAFLGGQQGGSLRDELGALITLHRQTLDERLRSLVTDNPAPLDQAIAASAQAGWITAGGFLLELARLQQAYGTLAANALPSVQMPLLAQSQSMRPTFAETISSEPALRALSAEEVAPLMGFYQRVANSMRLAHAWLYDRQLADLPVVLPNPFDLKDRLTGASDPGSTSSLFGHVLNDAAVSFGVWNSGIPGPAALPSEMDQPVLALPAMMQSAVTGLAEFGQRQTALGNYLFGIAGPDIAPAGTLAYTLLLGACGVLFMASGFALMFLIPLLPFLRFFIGILAWLLSVFEAIIAIPIVALAYLNISGEGLAGGAGRRAYLLWLNIIIRPVLTLFGFVLGLMLFTFAIALLGMIFHHLMRFSAPANGGMYVTANVALTFLYTILAVAAANASFKGISLLPEMVFKWLGGLVVAERGADQPPAASPAPGSMQSLPGQTAAGQVYAPARYGNEKSLENRIAAAAARAYGMGVALLPSYLGGERGIAADAKSSSVSASSSSAEARQGPLARMGDNPHAPLSPHAIRSRDPGLQKTETGRADRLQTPDKNPKAKKEKDDEAPPDETPPQESGAS
ncbi:MAG: DotA/TraY family protein [Bdellovibrionales bacterium]